ncbi:hypothetical protein XENTR_v10017397 [Xenopus tropicalis]|nr:hypothetical protein XENTR_v10017397 [Xenopus tropicalis]
MQAYLGLSDSFMAGKPMYSNIGTRIVYCLPNSIGLHMHSLYLSLLHGYGLWEVVWGRHYFEFRYSQSILGFFLMSFCVLIQLIKC